jgi:acetyltransferase-like isoleucine patch superfamily enzyme
MILQSSARVLRRDGVWGVARAAMQVLRARWYFRSATKLGSARLRGRANVTNRGELVIADRVRLDGTTVRLDIACFDGATLSIGEGTYINYGSNIAAVSRVEIGANCLIGQYAIIMDSDHHDPRDHTSAGKSAPVLIEDNVWLGARVTVLRGAHIGEGAVIGAHSVVTGTIPPHTLAAGAPARVIRSLEP